MEFSFTPFDKVFNDKAKKNKYGAIQITDPFFSTTKIFMWDKAFGARENQEVLKPTYLWDKFHYINNPEVYQYILKKGVKIIILAPFLIVLFLLGYFVHDLFYFVLIGASLHLIMDWIAGLKEEIRNDKFSIILSFIRFKKLKQHQ